MTSLGESSLAWLDYLLLDRYLSAVRIAAGRHVVVGVIWEFSVAAPEKELPIIQTDSLKTFPRPSQPCSRCRPR